MKVHEALERAGRARGYKGARLRRFIYGIKRRQGWRPKVRKAPRA